MEWFSWVSPIIAILGVVITAAVGYYRIGQNEKKIDQVKADQVEKCKQCLERQKEERNAEAHRYERAVSLAEHNSAMLASHIATNASEHTKIEVSAARTEEQLKALGRKMDEISNTLAYIVRNMPREYRPQETTHGIEKKG